MISVEKMFQKEKIERIARMLNCKENQIRKVDFLGDEVRVNIQYWDEVGFRYGDSIHEWITKEEWNQVFELIDKNDKDIEIER